MTSTTLYVIGNGFDRYHKVASDYKAFGEFVRVRNPELFSTVGRYLVFDDNWSGLEATLAELDAHTVLSDAEQYLVGYGSEEWREGDNHAYQDAIAEVVNALTVGLKLAFTEWILSLSIPAAGSYNGPRLRLDRGAQFVTFNYTLTLESLYEVPQNQIHYLHGRAVSEDAELILGHGADPKSLLAPYASYDPEEVDPRVHWGNTLIARYFRKSSKPTSRIIADSASLFSSLRDVRDVVVIGHSLADVDLPYFKAIAQSVDLTTVSWTVTYHTPGTQTARLVALNLVGIPSARISQVTTDSLAKA